MVADEECLILWRHHHSPEAVIGVAESGEDLASHPKVWMPHVLSLFSACEREGDAPKLR
jgi:hypothetical protein